MYGLGVDPKQNGKITFVILGKIRWKNYTISKNFLKNFHRVKKVQGVRYLRLPLRFVTDMITKPAYEQLAFI